MSGVMYLAVNNSVHHGFALGDTVCAIKAGWLFAQNERCDKIILSLNKRGGDLNFLWDKFIRTFPVEVIWDDFCPNNLNEKYSAFDHRFRERKVKGQPFDLYREIYVRLHGGDRQRVLCGAERGLTPPAEWGQYNLWKYYYVGQETFAPNPVGLDEFSHRMFDLPERKPKPRSLLIAPHAHCQTNRIFTFAYWRKIVELLLEHDPWVTIYLNTADPFFADLAHPRLEKGYRGIVDLFTRIPQYGAVACGNTGVGWAAAAGGAPLFAMQDDDSHFRDFRYEWCGVESLQRFFRLPEPLRVAQALLDFLDARPELNMVPATTLAECYAEEAALERYVPAAGKCAVDVGANDGRWTRFLASRFERVEAVEPQPQEADKIRQLRLPNVRVHQVAAGMNLGRLHFRQNKLANGGINGAMAGLDSHIISQGFDGPSYDVECRPLDLMGLTRPVGFLKIDVDGADVVALLGAQAILRADRPVVLIETHNEESRAWMRHWLPKLGYQLEELWEKDADPTCWNDRTIFFHARPTG